MSWYKNNPELFVNYGGWNVKGFFKLKNSTSSEMFSRLNKDIIITASDKGYGKCGYLSIDGRKYVAYLPLDIHSGKDVKDIIPLEKCCVVVMSKYGEDDIYRIIESEGVTNIDDSRLGVDIFEHVELYDTSYKEVSRRKLNSTELSNLNIYLPGVVADNGHGGYYCKLFAKGSSTQFYNKTVDPLSEVTTNDLFDITKCEVRSYKRADSSEIKIKIFIPEEAKDLSRIEAQQQKELETEKRHELSRQKMKQRKTKLSISHLQKYANGDEVEIDTIINEYQHLCSLIGEQGAKEYRPLVNKALSITKIRLAVNKKKKRDKLFRIIELIIITTFWITIWGIAFMFYDSGNKNDCISTFIITLFISPVLIGLIDYFVIRRPFNYHADNQWARILFVVPWFINLVLLMFLMEI